MVTLLSLRFKNVVHYSTHTMKSFLKKVSIVVLIIIALVFIFAFIKHKVDQSYSSDSGSIVNDPNIPTTEEGRRSLEEAYLAYAVDRSLFPYALIEIPALRNIATSTDSFGKYLALSLFPGQELKNGGVRSEVSIDYPYKEGDTVEYSWEFRIPKDFTSDAPKNRWWVFANWHDQPDKNKGETWDTYQAHSAPIIFGYGSKEGKDFVSLSTGLDGSEKGIVPRGLIPITRDTWHSIRMVVTWSQTDTGRVIVYVDGSPSSSFDSKGPNMLNAYQHYMKIGQYRHPEIQAESTIHLKNISIVKR